MRNAPDPGSCVLICPFCTNRVVEVDAGVYRHDRRTGLDYGLNRGDICLQLPETVFLMNIDSGDVVDLVELG